MTEPIRVLLPGGQEIELSGDQAREVAQALDDILGRSQSRRVVRSAEAPHSENRWTRPLGPVGLTFFWVLIVVLAGVTVATATALTAASCTRS